MAEKKKSKTVSSYRKWKTAKVCLFAGAITCPIVPASIVTMINWEEWFQKSSHSLPFGFAFLLLTVVFAVVGIINSGTIFKKADVALFFLGGLFMCIGITSLFLAKLFEQMGFMWLYTGGGIIGSGLCVVSENKFVEPNIELYSGLVDEFILSKKAKRKQARIARARAEAEAEREGAVE